MDTEENPEEILCSLQKEMTLIKAEEALLKKQILSLNEQFQELMISVAEIYPDILNEDFAKKPTAITHENVSSCEPYNETTKYRDTLQRKGKGRWNEWREGRLRKRFSAENLNLKEEFIKPDITRKGKIRPSSLNIIELSERGSSKGQETARNPTRFNGDRPDSEFISTTPRGSLTEDVSPESNDIGLKLMKLDSERRRRIRQRLRDSRNKLDVVHLGLF